VLVALGNIRGILTAAHVWDGIANLRTIGFYQNAIRRTQIQNTQEEVDNLDVIKLGSAPYDEFGPDIAFVKLTAAKAAAIEVHSSFVYLDRHVETIANVDKELFAIDVIVGIVDELGQTEIQHGERKVVRLESLANVGAARVIQDGRDELDRIEFTPIPEEGFSLPASYGGTSGGGCFRALLSEPPEPKVVAYYLTGVVFWETKLDGRADKIICHGPRTIYEKLFPAIVEKWGSHA
jgi:hypothetical protein